MADCQYCEPNDPKCPGRGWCHCGCGQRTNPARHTIKRLRITKGDPNKYLPAHRYSNPRAKTPALSLAEIKALGG